MQFSTTQNTQNTQEAQQKHTQIDKEGIAKLMDLFYAKVRKDENLGRIFEGRIGTDEASWSAHKQKNRFLLGRGISRRARLSRRTA